MNYSRDQFRARVAAVGRDGTAPLLFTRTRPSPGSHDLLSWLAGCFEHRTVCAHLCRRGVNSKVHFAYSCSPRNMLILNTDIVILIWPDYDDCTLQLS